MTLTASRDGVLMEQMDTKRGFQHTFLNVQSMGAAQQRLDEQMRSGTAPASQQRRDLRVVIKPMRGQAAKLEFPFDLTAAGILPVRVDITNLTPRTYRIAADAVRLQRADRTRVEPLPIAAAAQQIAAARVDGAPLTTLSAAAIRTPLRAPVQRRDHRPQRPAAGLPLLPARGVHQCARRPDRYRERRGRGRAGGVLNATDRTDSRSEGALIRESMRLPFPKTITPGGDAR